MGQYHKLVNFTRKEFVESYAFANGAKLWEQVRWEHAFSNVTHFLLAKCSGRGGGDFSSQLAGLWGGDRVSLVGDYAEKSDFPFLSADEYKEMMAAVWGRGDAPKVTTSPQLRDAKGRFASKVSLHKSPEISSSKGWKDISEVVAKEIEEEFEVKFYGDGWKNVRNNRRKVV